MNGGTSFATGIIGGTLSDASILCDVTLSSVTTSIDESGNSVSGGMGMQGGMGNMGGPGGRR